MFKKKQAKHDWSRTYGSLHATGNILVKETRALSDELPLEGLKLYPEVIKFHSGILDKANNGGTEKETDENYKRIRAIELALWQILRLYFAADKYRNRIIRREALKCLEENMGFLPKESDDFKLIKKLEEVLHAEDSLKEKSQL